MKIKFLVLALLLSPVAVMAGERDSGVLPGSNQLTPVISTAATPAAVAISSLTPTRIDAAVNTSLATSLGNGYQRTKVEVQIFDAAKVNCGYSMSVTTQPSAGFQFKADENPISFNLGKAVGIYCQGIVSTATYIVGGMGFRQ